MNAPILDDLATDLLESADGLEVVTTYVEFLPGMEGPTHTHPGEEFAHILEGSVYLTGFRGRTRTVAELVAAGATNPEIAEQLFVSVNTIKTHFPTCSPSSRSHLGPNSRRRSRNETTDTK